ncbi:MAG: carboxypeptidase regulatory-like domain-containing protein, partial [Vicinamibacterales bacterium]
MRGLKSILLALSFVVIAPWAAHAQATLAGVVRDSSGAVLPGVTVEAASPVLIEKVRTASPDGTGRYQIIDLRPGDYSVTFTLSGFAVVKRDGVELTGTAVTTVNADLRIGNLAETITVSGDTPTVDLQTTTRQTVMDQEVVAAIPTSRNSFAVGVLIPGVTVSNGFGPQQDVGGALGPTTLALMAHGSRVSDQRLLVNGVSLSTMIGGGWGGGAIPNATGTAEFAIDTSGVDATLATGGVRTNFIPRDGGNQFSGTIAGAFATEGFASDNYTNSDLKARGLSTPG